MDSETARRETMVREQIARRGVAAPEVLHAMRAVPRHEFVPAHLRARAYDDRPLPIGTNEEGHQQTISQPYIVAAMTEALALRAGDRVLEIGTGSGYQAAVLAEVASEVFTIERVPALAESAARLLQRLRYENVQVRLGDGAAGWPEEAPFAGILVACGAPHVPAALEEQLAPGGRIVIPLGEAYATMQLELRTKRRDGKFHVKRLMPVRFVPFLSPTLRA